MRLMKRNNSVGFSRSKDGASLVCGLGIRSGLVMVAGVRRLGELRPGILMVSGNGLPTLPA